MAAEDFFNRWSRRQPAADGRQEAASGAASAPLRQQHPGPATREPAPPPTLADVQGLQPDSDYAAFMAGDVDEAVRRSAMKKLFSDPHFNVMDGLDVYIEDYNKFEPIPAAMLGALHHAKALLDPLSQLEQPSMKLLAQTAEPEATQAAQPAAERLAEDASQENTYSDAPACAENPEQAPTQPDISPAAEQNERKMQAQEQPASSDSPFSRP